MVLEPNQWRVLVVLVTDVSIACFVLSKNPRHRINQYWFLVGMLLFITNLRDFLIPFTNSPNQAINIVKFVEVGIFFLPTALWLFVNEVFRPVLKKGLRATWTKIYLICSATIYLLSFIPFINHYEAIRVGTYYIAKPGITSAIAFVFYQFAFAIGIFYAVKAYLEANISLKRQIRIIFISIAVFSFAEIDFLTMNQLSPNTVHYGYLAIMAGNMMIAYSILRHRVMDIVIILRKGLAYSAVMAVLAGAYVAFVYLGGSLLKTQGPSYGSSLIITIPAIIVIALAFEPLRVLVQRGVDKIFFKTRYDYQEAIKQFSRMVVTILNLDILLHQTALKIQDILKIRQAVVYIYNPDTLVYEIGAFAGADETDVQAKTYSGKDPLVKRLMVSDERVQDLADEFGFSVVVSFFMNRELIGFVILGEKMSGDPYSVTDFELLSTLSDQLAIAIENARLYQEATTDKLTKVFTGSYFYNSLEKELERSREQDTQMAILLFDVDRFMDFSRDRGTAIANQALALVGSAIQKNCHTYDIAARVGDDEFAVMLPGASREAAAQTAGRIQEEIKATSLDGIAGLLSVSSGIAYTAKGVKPSRRLISEARLALISNKHKQKHKTERIRLVETE